ncbi:MAG: hypothetical protein ACT4QG_02120 [Sporichthyaceae bacterium]
MHAHLARRTFRWGAPAVAVALAFAALPATGGSANASAAVEDLVLRIRQADVAVAVNSDGSFSYGFDVFVLPSGKRIGSVSDRVSCSTVAPPPCLVFDVVSTFKLPRGSFVTRGQWASAPDPLYVGSLLLAARPTGETISSGEGAYAGRSGRAHGWGVADVSRFPSRIGVDNVVVVDFE